MPDSTDVTWDRYEFAFTRPYRVAALPFGITPGTAWVALGRAGLRVRFGPWRLRTTLDNLTDVTTSGPFGFVKTAGPPHLSFVDRGVTFATNGAAGVCLSFRTPVAGIDPTRVIKHPGATLTVADPARFADAVRTLLAG